MDGRNITAWQQVKKGYDEGNSDIFLEQTMCLVMYNREISMTCD